jgi:DNA-binding MarR family transcriptional regulator
MKNLSEILEIYLERSISYRSKLMSKNNLPGLSIRQFYYLDLIRKLKSPTLTEVSNSLGITKPSGTEVISKLISLGYLKKEKDLHDKREIRISITKKGKEISKITHDANEILVKELEGKLSQRELNSLSKILKKGL